MQCDLSSDPCHRHCTPSWKIDNFLGVLELCRDLSWNGSRVPWGYIRSGHGEEYIMNAKMGSLNAIGTVHFEIV